jgi:hypothetical protein
MKGTENAEDARKRSKRMQEAQRMSRDSGVQEGRALETPEA